MHYPPFAMKVKLSRKQSCRGNTRGNRMCHGSWKILARQVYGPGQTGLEQQGCGGDDL